MTHVCLPFVLPQPVGGDPNASIPANFSMPTTTTVNGQTTFVATMAPATAGEAKEGEEGTSEKAGEPAAVPHVFHAPQGLSQNMQGAQFIMAPPHMQASLGGPPGAAHFVMAPNFPQARISNEPGPNGVFTLDLTEDSTDLPLPMEDEVDLSTYSYKINLGKDVVSGKGGKVQQLNRHFRNMVAAAYPTYDSTSSKISKRKIGLKIYQAIIDRGGRFLDPDGKPMDRPKSVLKVMKALKDAKTWTSDAKRVAKRKRDEQKTRESLDKKPRMMEAPVVTGDEKDPLTSAAALASVEGIQPMVPVQAVVKEEAVVADDDKKEEGKDGDDSNVGGLDLLTKAAAGESGPKAKAEV